ncbi:MAG: DUF3842 family protein [Deltaproteobacteria bacterium]|nr:DUF3842 family protein [Deltaproteobacteria bacterium]MBW1919074.1 DUF3842 family protein [Deltaproteobacteria bacterium]MBW1935396.1 DUF3842 family protein [Deltaproteobacteria bacterium]MBW1976672.1 DUF3842 family protein [Deltaproteobacteria bacterium]MBW2043410.1 DUF3842 family protein [Deltaproteobacteria bacterium]
MPVKVMVTDGQGGGIGATVIKGLRAAFGEGIEILALGTNSIATSRMMKAGANKGATGENPILRTSPKVDVIIGPVAILMPNAMMGEVSPGMAEAICSSEARKILIPLTQENVLLVGVAGEPLPHLVDEVVKIMREMKDNV